MLTVSGVHSSINIDKKDQMICLDDATPDETTVLSAITLDTNTPSYLPLVYENDIKDKVDFILLSIDEPHI